MQQKRFVFLIFVICAVSVLFTGCVSFTKNTDDTSNEPEKTVLEVKKTVVGVDKTSYKTSDEIIVTWDIVETLGEHAWIGIIPSSVVHGSEKDGDEKDVNFHFIDTKTGTHTFSAPEAGDWDVRAYDSDDEEKGKEIGYISFKVE